MYTETHSVKSNPNGLITLQIGDGFPVNGSFSAIDWQHGPFFLKTEVDPNGGNNLSLVSVQQLLSVPYALYAEKAGSVKDAVDKGYVDNVPLAQRTARFRTVVALILDGRTYFFEGKVEGLMTLERHGVEGFGYDPIFLPEGYGQTFAEMDASEKNRISHRGRAMAQMVGFLERL